MIEQKQTKLAIFVLRWSIFTGPVTFYCLLINKNFKYLTTTEILSNHQIKSLIARAQSSYPVVHEMKFCSSNEDFVVVV